MPAKTNIHHNCLNCGISFKVTPAQIRKGEGKYCTTKCYQIRIKTPEYLAKLKQRDMSKRDYSKWPRGQQHWAYKKDRTQLKHYWTARDTDDYRNWAKAVKVRDSWICRIGNKNCNGKVEAHHILAFRNYPELRYDINNGITLCQFHHPKKRAEEQRLAPIFQELVKVQMD